MSNFSSNRRFRMEHLEDRRLMAGDLHAFVSQGTLFINEAPGHEGGAQNVAVSQLEGGKIRLTGLTSPVNVAGSLINNGLDRVEFTGVNNIVVNLGGGQDIAQFNSTDFFVRMLTVTVDTTSPTSANDDDIVAFNNFKVRDKLDINTGAGRDAVRIDGLTNFGDVWIRTGAADDLVTMKNANAGVNKDSLLWFDLGAGNDTLELGSAPNALGVVHGFNLRVDARDGNDRVEMRDAFFDFGVAVQLGIGDDVLNMANVQARTNMSVRGEAGNDTVNLTQVEAAENFFAFMGEGSDTLNVVNLKTQKAELNGGDGDGFDRLFFGQSPQVGSLIRSAFEEVNGQKLLKKVAVAGQPSAR